MTALALLLLAIGVGDLTHGLAGTPAGPRRATAAVGASILVAAAGAGAVGGGLDDAAVVVVVVAIVSVGWQFVRVRTTSARAHLGAVAGVALAAVLLSTVHFEDKDGLWRDFIEESRIHLIQEQRSQKVLLVLALGVVLTATANAVVRIILDVVIDGDPPTTSIRGGRVIGPLERLLILGFVIAGQPAAAAIVVSAKSLLRYPELREHDGVDIHAVTEYVLIGSLTSWSLALAATLAVV